MRKIFLLLVAVLMQLSAFAESPYYTAVDGVTFYFFENEDGEYTITITNSGGGDYSSTDTYSGDVVIPSQITSGSTTYTVTEIGNYAFSGCNSLTSVVIPEGVTYIGNDAFSYCSSLTSVVIPEGVTSIKYETFFWCSSLTSVVIPESVTNIGDYAFSMCYSLTSVDIPGSVTSIGFAAFSDCQSLTSVVIPESVTSIGNYAFEGCYSLTSVVISEGVTSIGESAFEQCYSLTLVVIPESVTSIGKYAFSHCTLNSVYVKGTEMKDLLCFAENTSADCYLYVSEGMKDQYWAVYSMIWDYDHIIELKDEEFPKGLSKVTSPDAYEIGRYNLQGQKLSGEQKGINIIKYSDGTTQKVLVK